MAKEMRQDDVGTSQVSTSIVPLPSTVDFTTFYRRNISSLVALSQALCGSAAAAEDVAQDAMLIAFRRWDEVARLDSPASWVRRVCSNKATSHLRRVTAEARALRRLAGRRQPVVEAPISGEYEKFWAEVRTLPKRQAQAVALYYVCDLPIGEVAASMGCSDGSVKVHLQRARHALAARLGIEEGAP